jgi:hypothetical protein
LESGEEIERGSINGRVPVVLFSVAVWSFHANDRCSFGVISMDPNDRTYKRNFKIPPAEKEFI